MDEETKKLLKDDIIKVRNSKIKLITSYLISMIICFLSFFGFIHLICLITLIPLFFLVVKQNHEYKINWMMLDFKRTLIDDDYGDGF